MKILGRVINIPQSIYGNIKTNMCRKYSKYKKKPYIFFLFLNSLIIGCSNKINTAFKHNQYIEDAYNYVINDSIKFSHKSYGDVKFEKDKDLVLSKAKKTFKSFDNILLYGKTNVHPFYEYFILLNPTKKPRKVLKNNLIRDTIIDNNKLTFVGIAQEDRFPEKDFNYIFQNLKIGEGYRDKFLPLYQVLDKCFKNSNQYYNCLDKVTNFPTFGDSEKSFKRQMQLTFSSFLGNNFIYRQLLSQQESSNFNPEIIDILKTKSLSGLDNTILGIKEITKNERILMINENHFYPSHRLFLTKLLPELGKQGYKYLAVEALESNGDSLLNLGNDLSLESGFYTREQNFIDLIHMAKSLGFQILSYDDLESESNREINQAENLYNKTFAKDKDAKVIVLAGVAHILEEKDQNDKFWMAFYFKEKYGIDPLTISQTVLRNYAKFTNEIAFLNSNNFDNNILRATDYIVVNNLSTYKEEEGNFSYTNNHEMPVQLSIFKSNKLSRKFSYRKELPIKNFLLDKMEKYTVCLNPNESFTYYIFNKNGEVLDSSKIIWNK